jgi:hypothetical protein
MIRRALATALLFLSVPFLPAEVADLLPYAPGLPLADEAMPRELSAAEMEILRAIRNGEKRDNPNCEICLEGTLSYIISGSNAILQAQTIANRRNSGGPSGTIFLELWVTQRRLGQETGFAVLASLQFANRLNPQTGFFNVNQATPYQLNAPKACYYTVMVVKEFIGGGQVAVRDWYTFPGCAEVDGGTVGECCPIPTPSPTPTPILGSPSWYFAEGAAYPDLQTFILIGNSNSTEALVDIDLLTEGNQNRRLSVAVPAGARRTVELNQHVTNTGVSAVLNERRGLGIAAERAMYVLYPGAPWVAAHATVGLTAPSVQWYLPEGLTGQVDGSQLNFQTFILLANPNQGAVNAEVTYFREDGERFVRNVQVSAGKRLTLEPGKELAELADARFATSIRALSGGAIFAERAIWWKDQDWGFTNFMEGNASPATDVLSTTWHFAEGNTADAEEFLLLFNPSSSETTAQLTFFSEGGDLTQVLPVNLPAGRTTRVDVGAGYNRDGAHGTSVRAAVPIAAERTMYWSRGDFSRVGAHNTAGARSASRSWLLPEGAEFDALRTEILILNGNADTATVDLRYLQEGAAPITRQVVLPGRSRTTIRPADTSGIAGKGFSTELVSNRPIVVERSMYISTTQPSIIERVSGTCSLGIRTGAAEDFVVPAKGSLGARAGSPTGAPVTPTPTPQPTATPAH